MVSDADTRPGVALIGAGMIGEMHVSALSALQDRVRLAAVVNRRPEKAAPLAAFHDGPPPRFTADPAEVAADPTIGIVIVATPPSVRIELIETLARAGKHILLEKPIARTHDEARQVVEVCEAAGVTLGMVFQHRMADTAQAAARLVAGGELGPLGLVEISAPLWRPQSYYDELGRGTYARDGGGVLLTQAIHSIDLALSLTGPVTSVQAMTATTPLHRMEAEDFATAGLYFASGAVGSLVASTASFPAHTEGIRLHFQDASLQLNRLRLDIQWRDGRTEVIGAVTPEDAPDKQFWHQRVIADFAQALTAGRAPVVSGREGLAAHQLIAAIEQSSKSGARINIAD